MTKCLNNLPRTMTNRRAAWSRCCPSPRDRRSRHARVLGGRLHQARGQLLRPAQPPATRHLREHHGLLRQYLPLNRVLHFALETASLRHCQVPSCGSSSEPTCKRGHSTVSRVRTAGAPACLFSSNHPSSHQTRLDIMEFRATPPRTPRVSNPNSPRSPGELQSSQRQEVQHDPMDMQPDV